MANSRLKCKWCTSYALRGKMIKTLAGNFCSDGCMTSFINKTREDDRLKAIKKAYGKSKPVRRPKALISRTEWLNKLQILVNQYILNVRDKNEPCCTCGTTNPHIKYDAGHCFTRKARPDIRFDHKNIHKQCSMQCNQHGSGMRLEYEKFIVGKYGQDTLDELKREKPPLKDVFPGWQDIEEAIISYRELLRENGIRPDI